VNLTDESYKTPGQFIQKLLDDRGWTQRILAIVLNIDETGLNKIVAGKRSLDANLALSIASIFDVKPEYLLGLQKNYDLAMARIISRPNPNLASRARLFGDLPVAEMVKRGWLDGVADIKDVPQIERALSKFFAVPDVADVEVVSHRAKKTHESAPPTPSQIAWLYRVRQIANEMLVARFSYDSVMDAIAKLSQLRGGPEEARKVPRIMAESGIRYLIVEALPSAKIDGVCLWLDDESPVIGMTLRYDRIDNFWFVLRHELEHVLRGHGKGSEMLDTELEGDSAGTGPDIPAEERVANEAAANFCVDQKSLSQFVARKAPAYSERDIIGFARTLRIHPGLVAGQLQRHISRYDRFRNHLVKIRASVLPGAVVDGWGNVVTVDFSEVNNVYQK
jgi:HTH-type transcriptional regulator/antitoxin HigA